MAFRTLGIETSCDETAVAVLEADEQGCRLLGEALATRPEEHAALGGIVPELTVRQHLELLPRLTAEAQKKIGKCYSKWGGGDGGSWSGAGAAGRFIVRKGAGLGAKKLFLCHQSSGGASF